MTGRIIRKREVKNGPPKYHRERVPGATVCGTVIPKDQEVELLDGVETTDDELCRNCFRPETIDHSRLKFYYFKLKDIRRKTARWHISTAARPDLVKYGIKGVHTAVCGKREANILDTLNFLTNKKAPKTTEICTRCLKAQRDRKGTL